jgi:hypothetical protein
MSESLGGLESARVLGASITAMASRCNVDDEPRCDAVYLYRLDRLAQARKAFLRACEVACSNPGLARALASLAVALFRQALEHPRIITK